MKLSELLVEHPELDLELGDEDGRIFLDGVYLFRVLAMEDAPGDSYVYIKRTEHTDGIVYRGLVMSAVQISANDWAKPRDISD